MRIAHVVPFGEQPWSGITTVIVDLSAALARRGHDVTVWQLRPWDTERYASQQARLDAAGVAANLVPFPQDHPWLMVGRVPLPTADIVHLHAGFNPSTTRVARSLSGPYAFSPHGNYMPASRRRSRLRKDVYAWLFERGMIRRAALLCALSEEERRTLEAFGPRAPIAVIPNGVNPPSPARDGAAWRARAGVPD
ncbi:MAG: glycosyltransferase, partial [Nitriliruptorales bacterium]|nr:glycosyltransferase [Nitriliruptorales bacterium]